MSQQNKQGKKKITELVVHGLVVQLVFSEEDNPTIPNTIRDILKESYLHHAAC